MTTFIIMALSITVGTLKALLIVAALMLHPKVMKFYMKYATKLVENGYGLSEEIEEEKGA